MPYVSVIIPAYNAMRYLPETVDSVFNQTFDDFELIIVNDGSSDSIEAWCAERSHPKLKLVSQTNQGLAIARNTGIAHSQGAYLAFLDADDLWHPTKLEKQVNVFRQNSRLGLVYTWVAYINENGALTGRVLKHQDEGQVWDALVQHNIVECGSVPMVSRACLDQVGWFDVELSRFNVNEDWDMWLRIAAHYSFAVIKEPLTLYRQRVNSASRQWKAMEESIPIVIEKAFAAVPSSLATLKSRSYGGAQLCLAWKALQSSEHDVRQAKVFRQRAQRTDPTIWLTKEYFRLSIAIALMQWLKPGGYRAVLELLQTFRRLTVGNL